MKEWLGWAASMAVRHLNTGITNFRSYQVDSKDWKRLELPGYITREEHSR